MSRATTRIRFHRTGSSEVRHAVSGASEGYSEQGDGEELLHIDSPLSCVHP